MAGVSDDREGQSVWSWTVSLWTVWSCDQTPPFSCPARKGEVTKMLSYLLISDEMLIYTT